MKKKNRPIILLYNDDSHIKHGSPEDLIAIQGTVTASRHLHETLRGLGYATELLSVQDSLQDLSRNLDGYSPAESLVFNNCDGFDGCNQDVVLIIRLLEEKGFKHTGATAEAVELCIDKPRTKACFMANNIPTPKHQVFLHPGDEFQLEFPVIIKPAVEDGSIGITLDSVVSSRRKLYQQVKHVLETYEEPVLVEEFIPGRELAVAMLGNTPIDILPITEDDYSMIQNPLQHLLTYESKWDESSVYYNLIPSIIPADLTASEHKAVCSAAEGSFRAIGLRDFGRVDIRLMDGIPYVIDINELPDLSLDAGFWRSAQVAGMTYPQMVDRIVKIALQREGWLP